MFPQGAEPADPDALGGLISFEGVTPKHYWYSLCIFKPCGELFLPHFSC